MTENREPVGWWSGRFRLTEDQEPDTDRVCAVCCKPYEPHGFDGLGECPDCANV